jgi:hypothetical protein
VALGAGRSVGKKWVSKLLGLGGSGRLDRAADLLDGSVEREEGTREWNVGTASGRHCASLVVGCEVWKRRVPGARVEVFEVL